MKKHKYTFEQIKITRHLLYWTALSIPVSLVTGSIVALFLWLLDKAINFRFANPWLLFFLPVGGILIYVLYDRLGKNSDRGNNLIMDEIHQPGGGIPARMAPLVLLTIVNASAHSTHTSFNTDGKMITYNTE